MKTSLHQLPNPAERLPNAPISVRAWKAILSPAQMARYAFNAYDCLLSLTALQTMQNHDAATAGAYGRERATYDNLRTAMAGLYEASTVDLLLSAGILSVHLCVPGGSLSHWPVHIPQPAGAQLSAAQKAASKAAKRAVKHTRWLEQLAVEEEMPEEGTQEEAELAYQELRAENEAGLPADAEQQQDEDDKFNPPNALAYEHYT